MNKFTESQLEKAFAELLGLEGMSGFLLKKPDIETLNKVMLHLTFISKGVVNE